MQQIEREFVFRSHLAYQLRHLSVYLAVLSSDNLIAHTHTKRSDDTMNQPNTVSLPDRNGL